MSMTVQNKEQVVRDKIREILKSDINKWRSSDHAQHPQPNYEDALFELCKTEYKEGFSHGQDSMLYNGQIQLIAVEDAERMATKRVEEARIEEREKVSPKRIGSMHCKYKGCGFNTNSAYVMKGHLEVVHQGISFNLTPEEQPHDS